MGIISTIRDGLGSGSKLRVNANGSIDVVVRSEPPTELSTVLLPFRGWFKNGASSSLVVNGASSPIVFSVDASPLYDIFIKSISVEISDNGSPNLNSFGALSPLANGVRWVHFTQVNGEYELHEGIKTNKAFIRLGVDTPAIGTGVDAFLADVAGGGTNKSYFPIIDMEETYGMKYGLKLKKGSTDRISFIVQDNLTGLSEFNIVAHGFRV